MSSTQTRDSFEQRFISEFVRYVEIAHDPKPIEEVAREAIQPRGLFTRVRNTSRSRRLILLAAAAALLVPAAYVGALSLSTNQRPVHEVLPPPISTPRDAPTAPTTAPSPGRPDASPSTAPALVAPATPPAGATSFDINVGDVVSAGQPGPGAGQIETPGASDAYTFHLDSPATVYFDSQGVCSSLDISWRLFDENGTVIKSDAGTDGGTVCSDLNNYTLNAGTYTVKVQSGTYGLGDYSFAIERTPEPQSFDIQIGDVVSDGQPALGAGNLEAAGAADFYTFTVPIAERVYLDSQGPCVEGMLWSLTGPHGDVVDSDGGVAETDLCADLSDYTLAAGKYTVRVWSQASSTGTYGFQIWQVPNAQDFAINVGSDVSEGQPRPGAGNIETVGAIDRYTFSVPTFGMISIDALPDCVNSGISWSLLGANGRGIPSDLSLGPPSVALSICDSLGLFALAPGQYTIKVGGSNDSVGSYGFGLTGDPTQSFAIGLGQKVSSGNPGPGAGDLDLNANIDIFTFNVPAAERIIIDFNCKTFGPGLTLIGPNSKVVYPDRFGYYDGSCYSTSYSVDAGHYGLVLQLERGEVQRSYSFQLKTAPSFSPLF